MTYQELMQDKFLKLKEKYISIPELQSIYHKQGLYSYGRYKVGDKDYTGILASKKQS